MAKDRDERYESGVEMARALTGEHARPATAATAAKAKPPAKPRATKAAKPAEAVAEPTGPVVSKEDQESFSKAIKELVDVWKIRTGISPQAGNTRVNAVMPTIQTVFEKYQAAPVPTAPPLPPSAANTTAPAPTPSPAQPKPGVETQTINLANGQVEVVIRVNRGS